MNFKRRMNRKVEKILDPFHFGQPDPDPGSKNQPKSLKISTKINQNHKNIIHFFENINFLFNGHKYLPHE